MNVWLILRLDKLEESAVVMEPVSTPMAPTRVTAPLDLKTLLEAQFLALVTMKNFIASVIFQKFIQPFYGITAFRYVQLML